MGTTGEVEEEDFKYQNKQIASNGITLSATFSPKYLEGEVSIDEYWAGEVFEEGFDQAYELKGGGYELEADAFQGPGEVSQKEEARLIVVHDMLEYSCLSH